MSDSTLNGNGAGPAAPSAAARDFEPRAVVPADAGVLDQLLLLIRHQWKAIAAALVLIPLAAIVFTARQKPTYTATAGMLFTPSSDVSGSTSSGFEDPVRKAATNEALLKLGVLRQLTAERLADGTTPDEVGASVKISSNGEADLLDIEASAPDAREAARIANAYGAAFIAYREENAQSRLASGIAAGERQLRKLAREGLDTTPEAAAIRDRVKSLRVEHALGGSDAELVQHASAPSAPSAPNLKLNLALAIVLAALGGVGVAALLERSRPRRLETAGELEDAHRLPVLAAVDAGRGGPWQITGDEAERLRILRTNLRLSRPGHVVSSVLITSHSEGEGASRVARKLAVTMATAGDDVVLVDAHLRTPSQHAAQWDGTGLSAVLAGAELGDAIAEVPAGAERTVAFLPAGAGTANPAALLESARMRSVLAELERRFEFVIVDGPALGDSSDSYALVPVVSGVVIVAALGRATEASAAELERQLSLLGGIRLGLVATSTSRTGAYLRDSVIALAGR